jgi:hypothetical protein
LSLLRKAKSWYRISSLTNIVKSEIEKERDFSVIVLTQKCYTREKEESSIIEKKKNKNEKVDKERNQKMEKRSNQSNQKDSHYYLSN